MTASRFPRDVRLLRAADFERVFAARNSAANAGFALYGAANDAGHPRIGITVSRRIGNAVQRNRWKRRIRESFRLSQAKLPALDFVCIARSPTPPSLDDLMKGFAELAQRIERRIQNTNRNSERPTQ
jgi:ribonuclease P protein component